MYNVSGVKGKIMKRSIFIPLIGLVMTTAIVGSGFSVFYFYDHEVATNANM